MAVATPGLLRTKIRLWTHTHCSDVVVVKYDRQGASASSFSSTSSPARARGPGRTLAGASRTLPHMYPKAFPPPSQIIE